MAGGPGAPPADASGESVVATLDHDRQRRQGMSEVVYGSGKTPEQTTQICIELLQRGGNVLCTRVDSATVTMVRDALSGQPVDHHLSARTLTIRQTETAARGHIGIICAGTSDLPVADEAAVTGEFFGARVHRFTDIGVAGIHRVTERRDELAALDVLIVVAGMEGALPSVVAGLVPNPVIAVPTSVGYGASFGGVSALLGMLCSCAAGVTVVNIDNGYGAAAAAVRILRRRPGSESDA